MAKRQIGELSEGQQRVFIAWALAQEEASLLLLNKRVIVYNVPTAVFQPHYLLEAYNSGRPVAVGRE